MAGVVTISATFGAQGSGSGPAVAERLGAPFVDRALPYTVAAEIGCTLEEALEHDDRTEHGRGRLLSSAARLPNITLGGMDSYLPVRNVVPAEELLLRTEKVSREIAETGGGVVLGRASQLVLAGHPAALHVRLDGPRRRRLATVATMHEGAVVFALADPDPEVDPAVAREHAAVVATCRSDYPGRGGSGRAGPGGGRGRRGARSRAGTRGM